MGIAMKKLLKGLKTIFSLVLLGAFYGGLIGSGIALLTGNNALALVVALALALVVALALAGDLTGTLAVVGTMVWTGFLAVALAVFLPGVFAVFGVFAGVFAGVAFLAVVFAVLYVSERNKTTAEEIVEAHMQWLPSLLIALVQFLFIRKSSIKSHKKSKIKERAWDVSLIISSTQELTEVFPEEWDDWQHWINDMMELRTRMQSKGMNHRIVSLITFYRLFRFALHIGIDKVFILATRRATR